MKKLFQKIALLLSIVWFLFGVYQLIKHQLCYVPVDYQYTEYYFFTWKNKSYGIEVKWAILEQKYFVEFFPNDDDVVVYNKKTRTHIHTVIGWVYKPFEISWNNDSFIIINKFPFPTYRQFESPIRGVGSGDFLSKYDKIVRYVIDPEVNRLIVIRYRRDLN